MHPGWTITVAQQMGPTRCQGELLQYHVYHGGVFHTLGGLIWALLKHQGCEVPYNATKDAAAGVYLVMRIGWGNPDLRWS